MTVITGMAGTQGQAFQSSSVRADCLGSPLCHSRRSAMMRRCTSMVALLLTTVCGSSNARAQGIMAGGSGAMHRSMAGASTALGVDAAGALYWNPAAISTLKSSEVVIGSELIIPDTHLGSTVGAGAFGPLGPLHGGSGYTRSDGGLVPTTGLGLVYKEEGSQLSSGIGIVTLAAGGVNFPGDPGNPILAPTGPLNGFILGPNAGSAMVLGIVPTASYQITECLAVGFGPMIDVSIVSFDPAFFGPTSQFSPTDPRTFPTGSHSRPFWGGGFRAGATYRVGEHIHTGFSFTSPQWFETWRFNARDVLGNPETFETQFTLPTILSAGVAFDGIERLLLAADVRYFDYRSTQLLGEPVRNGGAGWDSIWALALGAKFQLSDSMSVQAGYLFNQNPVQADLALFNTQLPALIMHTVSLGAHMQVNESIGLSMAYVHGFKNSITGSVFQLSGSSTTIDSSYDSFVLGIHVKFGASPCRTATATAVVADSRPAPVEVQASTGR